MSRFLKALMDFLSFMIHGSDPEVQKKRNLKELELELRLYEPHIFKNGLLLPSFAELISMLSNAVRSVRKILGETICTQDLKVNEEYVFQLFLTGYGKDIQEKIATLGYGYRKQQVLESDDDINRVLSRQKTVHESIIRQLYTPEFAKIDDVIAKLFQLNDICRFNYSTLLHVFDSNYTGIDENYKPQFNSVEIKQVLNYLIDLYSFTAGFSVSVSMSRALVALARIQNRSVVTDAFQQKLDEDLRVINSITKNILSSEVLKKIICIGKKETDVTLKTAGYSSDHRMRFAEARTKQYESDTERIKAEIRDQTISVEIQKLFGSEPLLQFEGYNNETNQLLQTNNANSFIWVLPLQIIRTFLASCLGPKIRTYLEDLIIEGFFNNPNYKSKFSTVVYAAFEWDMHLKAFEGTFSRGAENDLAIINGLIQDSRKNPDFLKQLGVIVDNINVRVEGLIQACVKDLNVLMAYLEDVIADARKAKPENISNIRMIMNSARNNGAGEILDRQFEKWQTFIELMRNYAVIGEVDKDND